MRKFMAITLSILVVFQLGFSCVAFTDTVANNYTGKYYNHDDRFANHEIINGLDISYYQGTVDFDKMQAQFNRERIIFSINGVETFGHPYAKTNNLCPKHKTTCKN